MSKLKLKKWVTKNFVTGTKMCDIWENGSYLAKYAKVKKSVSQFKKCVTVRKLSQSYKTRSHLEKCVKIRKMCHSCKNESVRKIGHKRKNVEQLEKYVTFKKIVSQLEFVLELEKMCQTSKMCHSKKSRSQLGKRVTVSRVNVRKCATVTKMGRSYKYVSQLENMRVLENWVTTIKMA